MTYRVTWVARAPEVAVAAALAAELAVTSATMRRSIAAYTARAMAPVMVGY